MVSTTITPVHSPIGEKRVVFHNISWQSYEKILEALGEHRSARLTYDQGTLEITMPLEDHENARELIGLFIRILVVEQGLKIKTMGSTTLNFPGFKIGAEPDNCYYIQNQSKVAGKTVDLTQDPPPDLIVEVDITHTDINKNDLYANMGIAEFWRYNGQILRIYQLQDKKYIEVEHSPTFPWVEKTKLYQFLAACQTDEVEAEQSFRIWVQQNVQKYYK